ncbi:MAG: carboxylating nicotinate-nucleotide diphosphorylase [Candidatus Aminicenantes bacterium]|nr:carboxylating nicotinate-nucleotide diphosphorylase [Candidatus Aminicenantes bacterium]
MKTADLQALIDRSLAEDMPDGDVTTEAIVPAGRRGRAVLLAKQDGILAGLGVFARVFKTIDVKTAVHQNVRDGQAFSSGQILAVVTGRTDALLKAERTALNFVQRLSGIATTTREYVEAVAGAGARILDTRKTTPGLRDLEKYAVRKGGGVNHRRDLSSMVLIKDNHLAVAGSVRKAVAAARAAYGRRFRVEVEVTSLSQAAEAVAAGADWIMLDNMNPSLMRKAVRLIGGRAKVEASGNVSLKTVRRTAETGVDFISVGALTHSIRAIDLSLDIETEKKWSRP